MPHDGAPEAPIQEVPNGKIERMFPADFRWVRRAIHEIEDELQANGLTQHDVGSVAIILAEALNNIVEHAYVGRDPGQVHVTIRIRGASLIFELRDNGLPMPNGRPPSGANPASDNDHFDALPEGGFGWLLIRELVRDLVYDRRDGENILIFRYRLGD